MVLAAGCSAASGVAAPDGGAGIDLALAGAPRDLAASDLAGAAADQSLPAGGDGPYGSDGPASVSSFTAPASRPGGTAFTVHVYLPGGAGAHPVVILSSGFFQTAAGYAPYAQRLASWGVITLLRDDPQLGTQTPDLAADVSWLVTDWLPARNADPSSPLDGQIDVAHVGLAGHSRGGQVALLAAEGGAHGKVRGVFALDPVDGSMNGSAQARTTLGALGVPTAFLGETTDSAGAMACAPAADNYQVLYAAASSPSVAITAVGADHTMFEDPGSCTLCTFCTAGAADKTKVLALSVRYLTAFFARELLGDAGVGADFAGAGASSDTAGGAVTLVAK